MYGLDGSPKPLGEEHRSYSYAQKMRASITYAFGRVWNLGTLAWHKNEVADKWVGNPSVSDEVSAYMLSLRRRKVGWKTALAVYTLSVFL